MSNQFLKVRCLGIVQLKSYNYLLFGQKNANKCTKSLNANKVLIACNSEMVQDITFLLAGMIRHIIGVNLAASVIWSTDANKCTKALKTEKGFSVTNPCRTKILILSLEKCFT